MTVIVDTTNRVTICGQPGVGKTSFATHLAKGIASSGQTVAILDPLDQYQDVGTSQRVVPAGPEAEAFEAMCSQAWAQGNTTLFAEEAEIYIPQKGKIEPIAWRTILRGRNRGIGVFAITRRVADLNKTMFSLSEHVFIFRHFSPNDCRYLSEFLGREWEEEIRNLPDYHFLHFHHGTVTRMDPIAL